MIDLFLKAKSFSSNMITNELIIGGQKVDLGNYQLVSNWNDISYKGILRHFIFYAPHDNIRLKKDVGGKLVIIDLPYKESVILETEKGPVSISLYRENYSLHNEQMLKLVVFHGSQEEFNDYAKAHQEYGVINKEFLQKENIVDFSYKTCIEHELIMQGKIYTYINEYKNILVLAADEYDNVCKEKLSNFLYVTFNVGELK